MEIRGWSKMVVAARGAYCREILNRLRIRRWRFLILWVRVTGKQSQSDKYVSRETLWYD
jgi:hypothetical protein